LPAKILERTRLVPNENDSGKEGLVFAVGTKKNKFIYICLYTNAIAGKSHKEFLPVPNNILMLFFSKHVEVIVGYV